MSAEEYGLWMAQFAMEPWGDDRMDVGLGVVASTLANINRKAGTQPFTVADFAPYLRAQQEALQLKEKDATPAEFIKGLNHG